MDKKTKTGVGGKLQRGRNLALFVFAGTPFIAVQIFKLIIERLVSRGHHQTIGL